MKKVRDSISICKKKIFILATFPNLRAMRTAACYWILSAAWYFCTCQFRFLWKCTGNRSQTAGSWFWSLSKQSFSDTSNFKYIKSALYTCRSLFSRYLQLSCYIWGDLFKKGIGTVSCSGKYEERTTYLSSIFHVGFCTACLWCFGWFSYPKLRAGTISLLRRAA